MLHFAIRVLLVAAILSPTWSFAGTEALAGEGNRLVLGRISQEPRKHYARLQAMADYLSLQLAGAGVSGVDVILAATPGEMRDMIRDGKVDLLSETPFVAFEYERDGLVTLLLREWKKGVPQYHTLIIARKDGPIHGLADLRGHHFAFEDPGSTSGYLVPRAALEKAGLSMVAMQGPRDPVPEGKVGYSFAKGEVNVVAWVNRGLAEAGAVSNLDWKDESDAPAHLKQDLMVIHETAPIIRSLLMVRASLDEGLKQEIRRVLLGMHQTRDGQETLKEYFKVAKFDSLEGEALDGLETARDYWNQVSGFRD